jgi:NADH-quinone oxidoreductase subunit A
MTQSAEESVGSDGFLEFLGRAEGDLLAGLDVDRLAGGGVAAHAGGALAHLEDAEADDADALALLQALLIAPFLVAFQQPDPEKLSAYECGFNAFDDARMKFDVRFYLVAILFIIFDLEVAFLFPWAVAFGKLGAFGFWSMMVFLGVLTVGFAYEWKKARSNGIDRNPGWAAAVAPRRDRHSRSAHRQAGRRRRSVFLEVNHELADKGFSSPRPTT